MLENLKHLRRTRELTQVQLAKLSGVNRVNIAKYESGEFSPTLMTAQKLADALGVTVTDLMTKNDDNG